MGNADLWRASRDCPADIGSTHVVGDFACPNKPEEYLHMLCDDFEIVEYTYVEPAAAATHRQADATEISKQVQQYDRPHKS